MILRGLRDTLEAHHKVTITDEAIVAAAELSDRYITGRFLPDKAIDLIDQAAARVKISATARPVDVQELEAEVRQLKRETGLRELAQEVRPQPRSCRRSTTPRTRSLQRRPSAGGAKRGSGSRGGAAASISRRSSRSSPAFR